MVLKVQKMKFEKITENIEIHDLALYLKKSKTLIVSDFQLGYEEQLLNQGIFVPFQNFEALTNRLLPMLEKLSIETIVVNGDLKHEFGRITRQEWSEVMDLLDFLHAFCKKLVLVKGNHDTILASMAKQRNIEVVENFQADDVFVVHGDSIPMNIPKNISSIIIGHAHPAVSIRDGEVSEVYKCFLKGRWRSKTLIVQPSAFLLVEGSDIFKCKMNSPFLDGDLSNFEVWAVADEVFYFGKAGNLKS